MSANVSGTTDVQAPPDVVYSLVSDVTRMQEWATECERCSWVEPHTSAVVGARFHGVNRNGVRRWSTLCTVTAAESGRHFAFRVTSLGLEVSAWEYAIEPAGDGCTVTETAHYRAGFLIRRVLAPVFTGLATKEARMEKNRENIRRTLQSLKAAAEARSPRST